MDSYFEQLREIQNSTDHSFFLLDQSNEPRFIIDSEKRTIVIPPEFKFLGVRTDQRSEKIYFEIDRIFDDVDLSTKTCVIQYINAGAEDADEGIYPVIDLDTTTVPGKIVFKWEVDSIVCKYAGAVSFSVRFYEIDNATKLYTYCWNTIPETLPVLDGLNVSGSVIEDFPTELIEWNAKMQALNNEIRKQIADANTVMKSDLSKAKGYMDGAQAARQGAEQAEARVEKIVAGNEAYTKNESNTMYAKSQVKESERGTTVEVYPEAGSNLAVTVYGFTKQLGTGDPSPTNVRQLTNGGLELREIELSADWAWTANNVEWWSDTHSQFYVGGVVPKAIGSEKDYTISTIGDVITGDTFPSRNMEVVKVSPSGGVHIRYRKSEIGTTEAELKAFLRRKKSEGKPVIAWYIPAESADVTGLYAPIQLTGGEYRGICLPLTKPLCAGDTLVSRTKSGCDKVVVFDGSADEKWGDNTGGVFYTNAIQASVARPSSNAVPAVIYGDTVAALSIETVYSSKCGFGVNVNGVINIAIPGISSVSALKEHLAANPLLVHYRSTAYTEANDIPVSLETHKKGVLVVTNVTGSGAATILYFKIGNLKPKTYPICSHAPSTSPYSEPSGVYAGADGVTLAFKMDGFSTVEEYNEYFTAQIAAGTPVTIVYELATPITYAHPAVDLVAVPGSDGKMSVLSDNEISVSYHKSLDKTVNELEEKSYSKKKNSNIFARALKGTSDAATSVTIYPDKHSNVAVTAHGFTVQNGTGDSGPANVREIINARNYCNVTFFTGVESWYVYKEKANTFTTFVPSGGYIYKGVSNMYPLFSSGTEIGTKNGIYLNYTVSIIVTDLECADISAFKEKLSRLNNAGIPLTICYNKVVNGKEKKPLPGDVSYTSIQLTGREYKSNYLKLTQPLCEGDMVISRTKSGCDKVVVFDGSEDENWILDGPAATAASGSRRFFIQVPGLTNYRASDTATAYSSYLFVKTAHETYSANYDGSFSMVDYLADQATSIHVRIPGISTVSALKAHLKSAPLTIWYRSTEYTEDKDIPVSLETHKKGVRVLNGTENWATWGIGLYRFVTGLKGTNTSSGKCSHMPYTYSYAGNGIFVDKDGNVAIGTGFISAQGYQSASDWKAYLAAQYAAGTPVTIVYELATPVVYAHPAVDLEAIPAEDGSLVITGEANGKVSAEYNKDLTHAFMELQSAILALGAKLSL